VNPHIEHRCNMLAEAIELSLQNIEESAPRL
jgi:hypothetical protein